MKNIVIKKPDGGIIVIIPNHDKYGDEPGKLAFSECKGLQRYINPNHEAFDPSIGVLSWDLVEHTDIPSKEGLESRRQLIWKENENGNITYHRDDAWEHRLMCCNVLKRKHIKRLDKVIDDEHKKQNPDVVTISKAMREKEKCKEWSESQWYQHALDMLNERVSGGESDKPAIRKKLEDKISELSNKG